MLRLSGEASTARFSASLTGSAIRVQLETRGLVAASGGHTPAKFQRHGGPLPYLASKQERPGSYSRGTSGMTSTVRLCLPNRVERPPGNPELINVREQHSVACKSPYPAVWPGRRALKDKPALVVDFIKDRLNSETAAVCLGDKSISKTWRSAKPGRTEVLLPYRRQGPLRSSW